MASTKKKPAEEAVVVPSVNFNDRKKHIFEQYFDGDPDNCPEITSIGLMRLPESSKWVSYVMKTKGKHVTRIDVEEPDVYAIAEESAKMAFAEKFMQEGF